jgi:hypothetical protein
VDPVVQPCPEPAEGRCRIALMTRRRVEARLDHPVGLTPQAQGQPLPWGPRLAASRSQLYRPGGDGRLRRVQSKLLRRRWPVSGPAPPVHVFVVARQGYQATGFPVTSALGLTATQVAAVFAARWRQEDAFRDDQQRLGMAERRAWTKAPSCGPSRSN